MRLSILLFVGLCLSGALCSPGLLQRIQQLGRRNKPAQKAEMPVLGGTKKQETKAEETVAPVANTKQKQTAVATSKLDDTDLDACGGTILLDLNSGKEQSFSSSSFPKSRKDPYACSWNVKLSKSCKRGQVSLKFNDNSRLPGESRCTKGYVRVTPILTDSKICGNLSSLPALKWIVDSEEQRREEIAILMKNIGVNDGKPEGISFTLSGECLQDTTKINLAPINGGIAASWLSSASRKPGVTVYSRTLPVGKQTTTAAVDIDEIIVTEAEKVKDESTTKQSTTTEVPTTPKKAALVTTKAAAVEQTTTKPEKTYVSLGYYLLRRFIIPPEAKKEAPSSA